MKRMTDAILGSPTLMDEGTRAVGPENETKAGRIPARVVYAKSRLIYFHAKYANSSVATYRIFSRSSFIFSMASAEAGILHSSRARRT